MSKQAIYANIGAAYGQLALLFADLADASNAHNIVAPFEAINTAVAAAVEPSAAEVFAPAPEVVAEPVSAAEVFSKSQPTPPAPAGEPIYTMLPAANGYSREDLLNGGQGWTDDLLVSSGLMTVSVPAPKPPAPPVPTIPQPPQNAATTTPAAIEGSAPPYLDTTGLPWDARIHSGGRTQTAKGEWVKKKGVQPNVTAQVTAELRQNPPKAASAPQPAAHVPLAPPAAAAAPAPAPVPPAPATDGPTDGNGLLTWVSTNGHGPNMATVGRLMGLSHFGAVLAPENAHRITEAYNHFVSLKA